MSAFDVWTSLLFDLEGRELSMDPSDPGNYRPEGTLGGSRFGISSRQYPLVDMQTLTEDEAKAIARRDYWDAHNLDKFPGPVAILLADAFYNGGRPIAWLQAAVNTPVDEVWGDNSDRALAVAWATRPSVVLAEFQAARIIYDFDLGMSGDLEGWTIRCNSMLVLATQLWVGAVH